MDELYVPFLYWGQPISDTVDNYLPWTVSSILVQISLAFSGRCIGWITFNSSNLWIYQSFFSAFDNNVQ